METDRILTGDCFEALPELPAESVHACVTDPPYALGDDGFMGQEWDSFSDSKAYQVWCEKWATEARRVLKPGGHLLAFGGNTRHHRLFTGVEDAGFEIRDTLTWHYGSGFPKASDVSKTIDKREGAEREVVGENPNKRDSDSDKFNSENKVVDITKPATPKAKEWVGWKTGLKPATEYVVMARKPFEGATVDCVLEHGTGALNVDGCRIEGEVKSFKNSDGDSVTCYSDGLHGSEQVGTTEGRYPSNVVFGETEAARLDSQEEHTAGGQGIGGDASERPSTNFAHQNGTASYEDHGGPSRYFYTSKASRAERTLDGRIDNAHPTVKPPDLMEWLVKLVTAEGQTVLDPFAGSGTTCRAAKDLNRRFIGIEQQAKWADVARVRCGLTPNDPSNVRSDENQTGLEAYE